MAARQSCASHPDQDLLEEFKHLTDAQIDAAERAYKQETRLIPGHAHRNEKLDSLIAQWLERNDANYTASTAHLRRADKKDALRHLSKFIGDFEDFLDGSNEAEHSAPDTLQTTLAPEESRTLPKLDSMSGWEDAAGDWYDGSARISATSLHGLVDYSTKKRSKESAFERRPWDWLRRAQRLQRRGGWSVRRIADHLDVPRTTLHKALEKQASGHLRA